MGAAFSQYANMLVGMLQSVLNYQEYQETMDQMTAGKSMWFLTHMYGCYSASGRGNRISLADLFATPGLYENGICHGDFRNDLWYLSWKSGTGSLCRNSWNGICIFSGNQRLSVEQRTFAYGGKYLVACISGSCELDAAEESDVYSDHAVCIDTYFGLWVSLFPGKGERTDKKGFVNAYIKAEFCFEIKMNRNYTKEKLSG